MLLTLALTMPSAACGGLFCNVLQPVVQDAERIVFAIDEGQRTIDMHVQISYDGEADEFAWIIPVPERPELFLSNQFLFDSLAVSAAPRFNLTFRTEGRCMEQQLPPGREERRIGRPARRAYPSRGGAAPRPAGTLRNPDPRRVLHRRCHGLPSQRWLRHS